MGRTNSESLQSFSTAGERIVVPTTPAPIVCAGLGFVHPETPSRLGFSLKSRKFCRGEKVALYRLPASSDNAICTKSLSGLGRCFGA